MTAGGRLVLVGTPIGNLGDISPRAVEALARATVIACEDTRRTGRLLQHLGITGPKLLAVHEHNEAKRAAEIVGRLDAGEVVALVTDAGMPGVSDPGTRVVRAVAEAGHSVEVVPGPSAVTAALALSGLGADRFTFEGFLPAKGGERRRRLAAVAAEERVVVLYEAPHRLARTLADLAEVAGGSRGVVLAREITKLHEEVWRGTLADAVAFTAEREPRGEYVVVVDAAPPVAVADDLIDDHLRAEVAAGASVRDAVDLTAAALAVARARVYGRAKRLAP